MPDRTDHDTGRRTFLATGAVALGGAAASLVAQPAQAAGGPRAPMDTPITDLIYKEDIHILTAKAQTLKKADLIEMARVSRGNTRLKDGNSLGLSPEDLDSIEEAFWMVDVRDHNIKQSSLLPNDSGLIRSAYAGSCCCCCTAAAGFRMSGDGHIA